MINLKPEVLQALESNQELISLLGLDKYGQKPIYQQVASDPEKFPRITFFELSNFDNTYADDTAMASEIQFQIDVWSKGSTTAIAQEVDKTMKSLGFQRMTAIDLYEEDIQVFHKAMRYRTRKVIEEV